MARNGFIAALTAVLAGCAEPPPPPQPVETEVPEELRRSAARPTAAPQAQGGVVGTPMKDRTAILGLLNKRNNIAQDLSMKVGETRRIGDVVIALKACERTAPWEMPRETGAFVQVFVQQGGGEASFAKVFSGWLFRESPSLNVVEHPIYDVWVKECRMRFPGEEGGEAAATDARSGATTRSPSRPPSLPAPAPASPSPTPETTAETA